MLETERVHILEGKR